MKPVPRVVCDTNVILSALVFRAGRLHWLRECWRDGRAVPLVGRETAAELLRVLAYPRFRLSTSEREALLVEYLPFAETIAASKNPVLPDCRDPADEIFLALALAGKADALVTGDADLLVLAERFYCPILTPAGFRRHFHL